MGKLPREPSKRDKGGYFLLIISLKFLSKYQKKDIISVANKYIIEAMSKDHSSKIIFGSSNNNLEGLLSKGEN